VDTAATVIAAAPQSTVADTRAVAAVDTPAVDGAGIRAEVEVVADTQAAVVAATLMVGVEAMLAEVATAADHTIKA